jgi:hypothetical protein
MRAKVSTWARGLAALAVAGALVILVSAGGAAAVSAKQGHAAHVAASASRATNLASPDDVIWG